MITTVPAPYISAIPISPLPRPIKKQNLDDPANPTQQSIHYVPAPHPTSRLYDPSSAPIISIDSVPAYQAPIKLSDATTDATQQTIHSVSAYQAPIKLSDATTDATQQTIHSVSAYQAPIKLSDATANSTLIIQSVSVSAPPTVAEASTTEAPLSESVTPHAIVNTHAIVDTKSSAEINGERAWARFFRLQGGKGVITGLAPLIAFVFPVLAPVVDGIGRLVGLGSDRAQYRQSTFQSRADNNEAPVTKGRAIVQGITDVTRLGYSGLSIISNAEPLLSLALSMTIVGGIAAGLSILSSGFSLYKYREDIWVKIPGKETKLKDALKTLASPKLTDEDIKKLESTYFKINTPEKALVSFHDQTEAKQNEYRLALANISDSTKTHNPITRETKIAALKNHLTMQIHAQKKERNGQWWGIGFRCALVGANISQVVLLSVGIVGFTALVSNPVGWGIAATLMVTFLALSAIALYQTTMIRLQYRALIKAEHNNLGSLFIKNESNQLILKPRFKALVTPINTHESATQPISLSGAA